MIRLIKNIGMVMPMALVLLMCAGCKKTKPQVTIAIAGKWKLVDIRGSTTGGTSALPAAPPTYSLNTDSTYSVTPEKRSGIYHVTLQKSMFTGSQEHYVYFSNSADLPGLVALKNDTLIISDNHVNPVTKFYARVK